MKKLIQAVNNKFVKILLNPTDMTLKFYLLPSQYLNASN